MLQKALGINKEVKKAGPRWIKETLSIEAALSESRWVLPSKAAKSFPVINIALLCTLLKKGCLAAHIQAHKLEMNYQKQADTVRE